jgi:hypothetical protein
MFKIGEFSKLSNISVRSLRHYESLGLLLPRKTDPVSGYRYIRRISLTAPIQSGCYGKQVFRWIP